MFEENPCSFAPSDVTLNCDAIHSKHISRVVLREKVLMITFCDNENSPNRAYMMTTNVGNFKISHVPIPDTNVTVDLFTYDAPEAFILTHAMHEKFLLRNASFIVCLYDHLSKKSLLRIKQWCTDMKESSGIMLSPTFVLVANNTALGSIRHSSEVVDNEGAIIAKDHEITYFENKGDSESNTTALFQFIAQESYNQYKVALSNE